MPDEKSALIECSCRSLGHMIRVEIDDSDPDGDPLLIFQYTPDNQCGLWGRIRRAFLYIIDKDEPMIYGETVLFHEEAVKLKEIIDDFVERAESQE